MGNDNDKNKASFQNDEDKVTLTLDVPGVKSADLKVEVVNGFLTVSGSRKQQNGRASFQFNRKFGLDEQVDTRNLKANLSNGVLVVTAPKFPKPEPLVIDITQDDDDDHEDTVVAVATATTEAAAAAEAPETTAEEDRTEEDSSPTGQDVPMEEGEADADKEKKQVKTPTEEEDSKP